MRTCQFKVFFTEGQYEKVKADKVGKNIYTPSYGEKNVRGARFEFPVSKLSRDKARAGVGKIPLPRLQKDGSTPAP